MVIIQHLLALASAIGAGILIALLVVARLIWPILAILALITLWTRGPAIAESLGNGLAPRCITVLDSSQFDHTRGKWVIAENGLWSKVKPKRGKNAEL